MDPWLPPVPAPPDARLRLFCVPFAGGGAGVYRTWPAAFGPRVHVVPLQLPGRERRLREPAFTRMRPLVDAILPAIWPLLDRPFAIVGHSMGGAVAWELATALQRRGRVPAHLVVSARRAPTEPPPHPPLFHLPQAELVREVERRYGPLPALLHEHPSLLATFLPTLRADMELLDTWEPTLDVLDAPILAVGGADDAAIPPHTLDGWVDRTSSAFEKLVLPGGHFFLRDDDAARDLLARRLA